MFCKSCGKQIPDGAVVCPYCGQSMQNMAPPPPIQPSVQPPVQKIDSHLVEAILVTLCCCMPFGVISIVYATQVSSLANSGNFEAAQEASRKAHKWAMVSLGVGIVSHVLNGIFVVLCVLARGAARM